MPGTVRMMIHASAPDPGRSQVPLCVSKKIWPCLKIEEPKNGNGFLAVTLKNQPTRALKGAATYKVKKPMLEILRTNGGML